MMRGRNEILNFDIVKIKYLYKRMVTIVSDQYKRLISPKNYSPGKTICEQFAVHYSVRKFIIQYLYILLLFCTSVHLDSPPYILQYSMSTCSAFKHLFTLYNIWHRTSILYISFTHRNSFNCVTSRIHPRSQRLRGHHSRCP